MKHYNQNTRSKGKSLISWAYADYMLNAGKSVVMLTPKGVLRMKRKKHLTLLEYIKRKPQHTIVYDDY